MELEILPYKLTVCRVKTPADIPIDADFYFAGRTDEEVSLVCKTADVPASTEAREDGWRGFRIRGVLDFSLVGILFRISGILAEKGIGIFAVSTYNTDYILVKENDLDRAVEALRAEGYAAE